MFHETQSPSGDEKDQNEISEIAPTVFNRLQASYKPALNNRLHTSDDCTRFFKVYFSGVYTIKDAAVKTAIHYETARRWTHRFRQDPTKLPSVGRCGNHPPTQINKETKQILRSAIEVLSDEGTATMLSEIYKDMAALSLNRTTVKNFITTEYAYVPNVVSDFDREDMTSIDTNLEAISKILGPDVNYQKNCIFFGRGAFDCDVRSKKRNDKKRLIFMAAILPNMHPLVCVEEYVNVRQTRSKIKPLSFLQDALDKSKEHVGDEKVFVVISSDMKKRIPNIQELMQLGNCTLIEIPPASRFNPVGRLWPLLAHSATRDKLTSKEQIHTRLENASRSVTPAQINDIIDESQENCQEYLRTGLL